MANALRDDDFPMGRGFCPTHPKRRQLTRLVEYHAPEYAIAPRSEGFQSQEHDRYIRSKYEIITDVIEELVPREERGRFMLRKNRVWVVREGFNSTTKEVRVVIQERFNKLIKTWNGVIRPLRPLEHPPHQGQAQSQNGYYVAMKDNEEASKQASPDQEEEIQHPNVGDDAMYGNEAAALAEVFPNRKESCTT